MPTASSTSDSLIIRRGQEAQYVTVNAVNQKSVFLALGNNFRAVCGIRSQIRSQHQAAAAHFGNEGKLA